VNRIESCRGAGYAACYIRERVGEVVTRVGWGHLVQIRFCALSLEEGFIFHSQSICSCDCDEWLSQLVECMSV